MHNDDETRFRYNWPEDVAGTFAALRSPRALLFLFDSLVSEVIDDLLRAKLNRGPAPEIYSENEVIGFITALRPLMARTVQEFFALPADDRRRRQAQLDEPDPEPDLSRMTDAERADYLDWKENDDAMRADPDDPLCVAWDALNAALWAMPVRKWKQQAMAVVARPEAMIRDLQAMNAFLSVLTLMNPNNAPDGKRWTEAEHAVLRMGRCGCVPLLELNVIRDVRRVFR
jgi:hypothetical protein